MRKFWVALLGVVTVVPGAAQGLEVPPGRWWDRPAVVRALGLSPEQSKEIEGIALTYARQMVDLKAAVERAELDLRAAADAEPFTADRVREAFAQLQRARTRLEAERLEMILRIRGVLSGEQWQRLRRWAEQARARGVDGRGLGEGSSGVRPPRPRF